MRRPIDFDTLNHSRAMRDLIRKAGNQPSDVAGYRLACLSMARHYRRDIRKVAHRIPITGPGKHWAFSNEELAATTAKLARTYYLICAEMASEN